MDKRLQAAIETAKEAGALAQRMRADPGALQTRIKGPLDLVTAADHAAEALLRDRLGAFGPGDAFLGEEGGLQGTGHAIWIVDPIDGTVNFARGMPDWAVSVAYLDGDILTHGVIHAPDLNLTAWAIRGQGSFLNGKRIVFDGAPPQGPIVALGYSARSARSEYFARIERAVDAGIEYRRHGAATICFLGVLAGWFDAFHEASLNIWDAAAGLLLVDEAGGARVHDPFPAFLTAPSEVLAHNRSVPDIAHILTER